MAARSTGPSMRTIFTEILSNLRRKKLHTGFVKMMLLEILRPLPDISLTNDKTSRIFSEFFINFIK